MKKTIILIFNLILITNVIKADKFVWNKKENLPGTLGRHRASAISIGNKAYFGLGHVSSGVADIGYDDWWEFDPATNSWTQKANYPIISHGAVGFTIGNKGYMGSGTSEVIGSTNLFYEFDPVANIWTPKANCPLSGDGHISSSINGLGYIGLGFGGAGLYSYNPITNTWTLATNSMPGGWWGVSFTLNNKIYYVPSYSSTLYEYDPLTNIVTTKAPFPGIDRTAAAGFSVRGLGYVGLGTTGFDGPYDLKDIYMFDPVLNVWDTIPKSFPGARRHFVPCVTIGDNVFLGTGTNGTNLSDIWGYEWKISVGINEYEKGNEINVFPNPTTEILNIHLSKEQLTSNATFYLFSLDGKEVLQSKLTNLETTINVTELSKGNYFFTIIDSNSKITASKKIIIN